MISVTLSIVEGTQSIADGLQFLTPFGTLRPFDKLRVTGDDMENLYAKVELKKRGRAAARPLPYHFI